MSKLWFDGFSAKPIPNKFFTSDQDMAMVILKTENVLIVLQIQMVSTVSLTSHQNLHPLIEAETISQWRL